MEEIIVLTNQGVSLLEENRIDPAFECFLQALSLSKSSVIASASQQEQTERMITCPRGGSTIDGEEDLQEEAKQQQEEAEQCAQVKDESSCPSPPGLLVQQCPLVPRDLHQSNLFEGARTNDDSVYWKAMKLVMMPAKKRRTAQDANRNKYAHCCSSEDT